MEVIATPDTYSPSLDTNGNYVDVVPKPCKMVNGIYCGCGAREKPYLTTVLFSQHIKTKTHQKWIENLNMNKKNHFVESEQLRDLVKNQRLTIVRMEQDLQLKNNIIIQLLQKTLVLPPPHDTIHEEQLLDI